MTVRWCLLILCLTVVFTIIIVAIILSKDDSDTEVAISNTSEKYDKQIAQMQAENDAQILQIET